MQRLSIRTSWPLLAALVLCVSGLNYGLPKVFAANCMEVPLLPLLIIEVGASLAAAVLFYGEASPIQVIKLALVILALTGAIAGIAHLVNENVFSSVRLRPGSQAPVLTINWVFLLTVNISAIAVSKALIVLTAGQTGGRRRPNKSDSDR
ncbi:MAG TPA: hypothetical protein EYN91_23165 [Candidatus Melainabacteria bacterium]|jgi:hypothetical protein|nr:hypothetical protein [Candidatus Melainabacteria bacterium]